MNLVRTIRIVLLMLFALLQCVAPLAHAHVNGHNAGHAIHLAYADHLDAGEHSSSVITASNEDSISAVVGLPPEHRLVKPTFVQAVTTYTNVLPAQREYKVQKFFSAPRQVLSFLPFQHPCSQAPPA